MLMSWNIVRQIAYNGLQLHAVKNSVGISKGFLIACRCCYTLFVLIFCAVEKLLN
jgi:hypothetical protein